MALRSLVLSQGHGAITLVVLTLGYCPTLSGTDAGLGPTRCGTDAGLWCYQDTMAIPEEGKHLAEATYMKKK
eukprot:2463519-Rhodomonas_salina.1